MPTVNGLVSFSADPGAGTVIGPAWAAAVRSLGVQDVRCALRADAHNHLPLDLYKRAFSVYRDAGIRVHVVLDCDFNRPWLGGNPNRIFYPNSALGLHGNKRWSQWITDTCVRAGDAAKELGDLVASYTVANEGNLALDGTTRPVHIGENVPPVAGDKAPAMAAEVFYSFAFECAGWLRAAGATDVCVGSLSWLPIGSVADIGYAGNAYTSGYFRKGMQYLKDSGVTDFSRFSAHSVNSEGSWTIDKAQAMKRAIDAVQAQFGLELPTRIHEWGWPAGHGVNATTAQNTYAALSNVAERLFFYQAGLTGDGYGILGWQVAGTEIVPAGSHTAWYPIVSKLWAPTPIPPTP